MKKETAASFNALLDAEESRLVAKIKDILVEELRRQAAGEEENWKTARMGGTGRPI